MLLKELHTLIGGFLERGSRGVSEAKVVIPLATPSIGCSASTEVESGHPGIDWNNGYFFLGTKDRVVKKSQHEDVFDAATDLLMYLATKPSKRESYETRTAKSILRRTGHVDEDFEKYRRFFHREEIKQKEKP
jgi:hypothetical protein